MTTTWKESGVVSGSQQAAPTASPVQSPQLLNGAQAMGMAFWLAGARISYLFPISPQTEAMEYLARHPGIQCIHADSEYNVICGAQGVLWGGERCAITTASQGLVLMSEVMWEVSGNRLPMVMGVFNRGLKGPGWCLGSQQNDSLFMRDTGWLQFYCSSPQELLDLMLIAYRTAERVRLPAMVVGDGFYLSHDLEEVLAPSEVEAAAFVGPPCWSNPVDTPPGSYGGICPPEEYNRLFKILHRDVEQSASIFEESCAEFDQRFGRGYGLTGDYRLKDATIAIVTAGVISGTVRKVIDDLREQDEKIGLLNLHAFRPFPAARLAEQLQHAKQILVIDRNLSLGAGGILACETRSALYHAGLCIPLYGVAAGLGGLDVTPAMIESAIRFVQRDSEPPAGTLFLGEGGITS